MEQIKKGKVVKFRDGNGALNGGTVIEIIKGINGKVALINTLEGKNIQKPLGSLFLVKRQERGRISSKFLNNLSKELDEANKEAGVGKEIIHHDTLDAPPSQQVSSIVNNSYENEYKEEILRLKDLLKQKDKEILELNEKVSENSNVERLKTALKGLSEAITALSIESKDTQPDTIQILTDTIIKLSIE